MTIWDWHNDEFLRIKNYVNGTRYIGDKVPETDILICPDGWWLNAIEPKKRSKVIVYPCVKDTTHIKALGYKYAFCKDKEQAINWGAGAFILPPVFFDFNEPKNIQRDVCSIVHNWEIRDLKGFNIAKNYGVVNYGFPNNPTWSPESIINSSKYLFHPKEVGYLCNVVIKAISLGTPVIFTSESFTYGYKDYIASPLIADTKEQFENIINSETIYNEQINLYKQYKANIIDMQEASKHNITTFLNQIYENI
jgi:hypothetical protein